MAAISPAQVKELREKTGAGMMDCKQALNQTEGDMEAAVDWLRKKGLAAAAKKAGRVAAEGLVGAAVSGKVGAVVEVNAETDFVARNPDFQAFVGKVAEVALGVEGDVEALKAAAYPGGGTVGGELTNLIARIGENMTLRRFARLAVDEGTIGSYVHAATAPGLGKIGVLVALRTSGSPADDLGKQVAMHVAAANPQWATTDEVDTSALDRERAVLADQARASGKPENIVEKMVEGRLRKYYEEVVLVEQPWVLDPDKKVKAVLDEAGKASGAPLAVAGYVRMALGEGVEKAEQDFAAEVAATLKR
ncbi:MAG: translation elongation factor Ts [Alphaproteobacteria bacterium]